MSGNGGRPWLGLTSPLPEHAPASLAVGVTLWRGLIVLLPLAMVAAAFLGVEAGRLLQAEAEAIPWFVHLMTFGLIWILLTMAAFAIAAAATTVGILGIPTAFLLDRQLHRLLSREPGRGAHPRATMAAATVAGVVAHVALSWATGPITLLLPLAAAVSGFLVSRPSARAALRHEGAHLEAEPMAVPVSAPVPVATAPAPPATGARAPVAASAPPSSPAHSSSAHRVGYECPRCGKAFLVRIAPVLGTLCPTCRATAASD